MSQADVNLPSYLESNSLVNLQKAISKFQINTFISGRFSLVYILCVKLFLMGTVIRPIASIRLRSTWLILLAGSRGFKASTTVMLFDRYCNEVSRIWEG